MRGKWKRIGEWSTGNESGSRGARREARIMERQHGHSGIEKKGSRGTKGNWNREDSGERNREKGME